MKFTTHRCYCLIVCLLLPVLLNGAAINLDGTQLGRKFDGIGGLSGGGATSRFIFDYQEPYRSQILDYLFRPKWGAALQILKVEIGGDGQSTEGTEASHMHSRNDLNYQRGYEWSLMVEAKKRNPNIRLYALSWAAPGWVGNGTQNYYTQDNINYHIKWLEGARSEYHLEIDFFGVWNERNYNIDWIQDLRKAMDTSGFSKTEIVAADGGWGVADDMAKNPTFRGSVGVIGAHYPGTHSTANAVNSGKPLWASEDYSSYSDSNGGGCWGRILNQNYVNGYMTSTISWNLISAYYNTVPWGGDGLMWAPSPWTGHYGVQSPIWVSAHTTQFADPGWFYLAHNAGVGLLSLGGSYVTLVPEKNTEGDFSLVIETFTHDHSVCVRPGLPPYNVSPQTVTFTIGKGLNTTKTLYVWKTHLTPTGENNYFQLIQKFVPNKGSFTLDLDLDSVVTVTTTTGQQKGQYAAPPPDAPFPDSYSDTFANYPLYSEAHYWTDQTGSFEINQGVGGKVMRQMVTQNPVVWCTASNRPISVFGKFTSGDVVVTVDGLIEDPTGSVNVGARVINSGCTDSYGDGYFLSIDQAGHWNLSTGYSVLANGTQANFKSGQWINLELSISGTQICAKIGGTTSKCVQDKSPRFGGFVSIGSGWHMAQFRNFAVKTQPSKGCPVPAQTNYLTLDICDDTAGRQKWTLAKDGTVRLTNTTYCMQVAGSLPDKQYTLVQALTCNPSLPSQQWKYEKEHFLNPQTGLCLDIYSDNSHPCNPLGIWKCDDYAPAQNWGFSDQNQIVNIYENPGYFCLTATNAK